MGFTRPVVITGMGVVSPIGIGLPAFWESLVGRRSGVRPLDWFHDHDLPRPMGADVPDFVPTHWIRQRKALKVMSRVIQLGVAAADMAATEANLGSAGLDPDRIGVIFGSDMIAVDLSDLIEAYRACTNDGKFNFAAWGPQAIAAMYPLWMLKYLPNMPACHVGIFQDARGPNNTHTLGDTSGLTALAEAVDVIRRGLADAVIAGATSSRLHPGIFLSNRARQFSHRRGEPSAACRPFDADRDGMVFGEGAAVFVLEAQDKAQARGAKCLAQILGSAVVFEPPHRGAPVRGDAIRRAIRSALGSSGLAPSEIGHVNAHGLSTTLDDRIEAQAIRETLDDVPVTAPKSYFGNLAAAGGMVEMAVSVLAFQHGLIPPVLNYERPDPECPVRVIAGDPIPLGQPTAMVLNHSATGQAAAMVLAGPTWQ
jgi:3-oxoacyl-[acyl-carrier-protein] synthase II